jgi:hypothetical protein
LEVLAFRRVLRLVHGRTPVTGSTVYWFSDSMSAVAAATKWRAKAPGLARELRDLLEDARRYGCRIVPRWVSRDLGWQPLADALSKLRWRRDSAEWSTPTEVFRQLCATAGWQPSIDLFASRGNNLTAMYCSEFPEQGAWTSAFARSWDGVRAWAFPPFSAAAAMLRHLCRASQARILTLVPLGTRVPPRLRVISRTAAPVLRLVDAEGRPAPGPCPVALEVLDVATPDIAYV